MEDLITNAGVLFQQSGSGSPPLPAAPLNEPVPPVTYGSTHTKVTSMPPPPVPTSPRKQHHQKSSSFSTPRSSFDAPRPFLQPQTPQDFTPQLPPRPTNSIHPSLRAGPHAGSPARQPPGVRAAQFFDDQVRVQAPGSASSHEGNNMNGSSVSLPPPLPPRLDEEQSQSSVSASGMSTFTSSTAPSSATVAESHSREPSSKRSSRQIPTLQDLQDNFGDGSQPDLFSPLPPPLPSARGHSHDSSMELSSTAAAAAFASATPSPTSSHSGRSSPSKKSTGHGRKGSSE